MKKLLALLLAAVMVLSLAACVQNPTETTGPNGTNPSDPTGPAADATYTYNGATSEFPTVWNPHTYQTNTDADILDYISTGFYTFDYNENGDGYVVVPHLVTDDHPVDVTADYVGKYGVVEGDTAKVYILNLRDDLKWQDGTPITANDFVESAKRLLDPAASNYRADSLYSGNMVIVKAEDYMKQGKMFNTAAHKVHTEYSEALDADLIFSLAPPSSTSDEVYLRTALGFPSSYDAAKCAAYLVANYLADSAFTADAAAAMEGKTLAEIKADPTMKAAWDALIGWWQTEPNEELHFFLTPVPCPDVDWEEVGMKALSDTQLMIALERPLEGFYLKYSLTSSWLVHVPTYDACSSVDENGIYTNTYCTTVENTMSYGPYKLTYFEKDKQYKLEKNEYYFDLSEDTYQTTHIVIDMIAEASTRLEAFLQGKLDSYGLTADDMEKYALSDYTYYSTGDSTFAMTFNPDYEALVIAQAKAGENINKTILTLVEFRMAMSFAMDRAKFCLATAPTNSAAFGLYSSLIISDPDAGIPYRDTDVAKNTLAKFWGVIDDIGDGKLYGDIDEAIDSITGYNLAGAKVLFDQAYDKAIANGLMDADDVVEIKVGTPNNTSKFYNNGYEFIVNNYTEAVKGTKLEGKLRFTRDDTLGNGYGDALKNNQVDMLFGVGWTGSALDPYGLMEAYVKPSYQYDDSTDYTAIDCTITIDGVAYTASVWDWYCVMAGEPTTITAADGSTKEFSCGTADKDPETRLEILGALEEAVLLNYNFIPLMDDSGANLRGMQIKYHTEEYIFGMGFGGIKYYTYNYTDAEWDAYVAAQGGTLNYN